MSTTAPTATIWNETEAPKDGTEIVAIGGVMVDFGVGITKEPFLEEIRWDDVSQEWVRCRDGLALRRALNEEVIIHFWVPAPAQ